MLPQQELETWKAWMEGASLSADTTTNDVNFQKQAAI